MENKLSKHMLKLLNENGILISKVNHKAPLVICCNQITHKLYRIEEYTGGIDLVDKVLDLRVGKDINALKLALENSSKIVADYRQRLKENPEDVSVDNIAYSCDKGLYRVNFKYKKGIKLFTIGISEKNTWVKDDNGLSATFKETEKIYKFINKQFLEKDILKNPIFDCVVYINDLNEIRNLIKLPFVEKIHYEKDNGVVLICKFQKYIKLIESYNQLSQEEREEVGISLFVGKILLKEMSKLLKKTKIQDFEILKQATRENDSHFIIKSDGSISSLNSNYY
jgi:hypothetical protein